MRRSPVRVVEMPAEEPVSITDAVEHLRVSDTEEYMDIAQRVRSARVQVEQYCGLALFTQSLEVRFDGWPGRRYLELPRAPLQSVTSFSYFPAVGDEVVIDPADYVVDTFSEPGRIWLADGVGWPSAALRPGMSVRVQYVAGHTNIVDVSDDIRSVILLVLGDLYENRERTVMQPGLTTAKLDAVRDILAEHRRHLEPL